MPLCRDHPVVLGFDRFFAKGDANKATDDSARGGQLLLTELNCISCHKIDASLGQSIAPRQAPVLDGVGGRVRASYLRAFLGDPQAAKPGTTMPNVLATLPSRERKDSLEALVHFLASTGTFVDVEPNPKAITGGKKLFHQIGCAACHGPRDVASPALLDATVLPLGDLSKKYSLVSLTGFLHDPLKTRPSGRMPSLHLNSTESINIAHYLLADIAVQDQSPETVRVEEAQVKKGRQLFATLGCASCHNLKDGESNIVSTLKAPELAKLNVRAGCLAEAGNGANAGARPTPRYALNAAQRAALTTALKELPKPAHASARQTIAQTLATFNCYACHQRDGIGGVEAGLNDVFLTTHKEMGDEGRLPPHLSGVGGKLTAAYLKKVLANGGTDRPYMLTRMPKFGEGNIGHLQAALEAADPVPAAPMPAFKVDDKKVKSAGRNMVGNRTFGCIKCHNFREYKSEGIQGMNMTIMADRLRREWFTQYLLDPNKVRPGTRMPAVWPFGQSQLPKVLEGDTAQQIEAVWRYLADGTNAALPYGVTKELMPLVARDAPIIYRNFIAGAGNRAIGVGYPEKINLAFDANDLRYALIWHKEFIDASRHWTGRGEGAQRPLGEGILQLAPGPSIAILEGNEGAWPVTAPKDKGYQFRGYRFDDKLRPTFLYDLGGIHVEDFMLPVQDKDDEHFRRTVTITAGAVPDNLWFRAAAGAEIKDIGKGRYAVGNDLIIRLDLASGPIVRAGMGKMELLVPIRQKQMKIVQEWVW